MTDTILIADDEPDLLAGLERTVAMELDCRVILAQNGEEALRVIETEAVDMLLADIRMPGMDGLALLHAVKKYDPAVTVIVMTAYGTIEKAVQAIKAGAFDFIQKPFEEERLLNLVKNGLELNRLVRENARLRARICERTPFENMVGKSQPMTKVFKTIEMLARTDVTVLILGETGTGKDLATQAIHELSLRRQGPMVTVNCPALPENILESELFGYLQGAFTDAKEDKKGLFDQAHGSTLFLDEIGDLSPALQTKLLRFLQDKHIKPLGATTSHEVDVRIIAATNQDLTEKIKTLQFRKDLYYRLNVVALTMPPLRDIREDIPLLVDHFLNKIAGEQKAAPKKLAPEVLNFLLEQNWPGNIRELENTIRGWIAVIPGPLISLPEVTDCVSGETAAACLKAGFSRPYKELKARALENFTLTYLKQLLAHTGGNVSLAAEISGIKRQSLQKIIKRYNVQVNQFRR